MAIKSPQYWYVNYGNGTTTEYYAMTPWQGSHAYSIGTIIRQYTTPTVGYERCFVATLVSGDDLSGGTEPLWSGTASTRGQIWTDNHVTWQECTGVPIFNGDSTNTASWSASTAITLGYTIIDGNSNVQMCNSLGTTKSGSPPSFSPTPGNNTTDGTAQWVNVGAASNFTTKYGAPHARLATACSLSMVVGDVAFIGNDHAETQSSAMTITSPGTAALPCQFLTVDHTVVPPTATTTGATISTTGASLITLSGYYYYEGVQLTSGDSTNISGFSCGSVTGIFKNCAFIFGGTGTATLLTAAAKVTFDNITVQFAAVGQSISLRGAFVWRNTTSAINSGGSKPTTLFTYNAGCVVLLIDIDLSFIGSNNVFTGTVGSVAPAICRNVKTGSGITWVTGSIGSPGFFSIQVTNYSNTTTNNNYYYQDYMGKEQSEGTIVRTGGASDGTSPVSRSIVTTANTNLYFPFYSEWSPWYNTTTGSQTVTCYFCSGSTLTNADIWLEVEYLPDSGDPLGAIATGRVASVLASNNGGWTTDSTSTWGTGHPSTFQSMTRTFNAQMSGMVRARVVVAKPSLTMYFDPFFAGTSGNQYMIGESGFLNSVGGSSGTKFNNFRGGFCNG